MRRNRFRRRLSNVVIDVGGRRRIPALADLGCVT